MLNTLPDEGPEFGRDGMVNTPDTGLHTHNDSTH